MPQSAKHATEHCDASMGVMDTQVDKKGIEIGIRENRRLRRFDGMARLAVEGQLPARLSNACSKKGVANSGSAASNEVCDLCHSSMSGSLTKKIGVDENARTISSASSGLLDDLRPALVGGIQQQLVSLTDLLLEVDNVDAESTAFLRGEDGEVLVRKATWVSMHRDTLNDRAKYLCNCLKKAIQFIS